MKKNDYYVYVYSDPDTRRPFYVGKGRNDRVLQHLKHPDKKTDKGRKILEIQKRGKMPVIEIVNFGLAEDAAFAAEAAMISYLGTNTLTNLREGKGSYKLHADYLDFMMRGDARPLKYRTRRGKNVLLLSLNRAYVPGMSKFELYDAARGPWHIDKDQADTCELILGVWHGFVLEVWQPTGWSRAGLSLRGCACRSQVDGDYEFTACIASSRMRNRFIGREVPGFSGAFNYAEVE